MTVDRVRGTRSRAAPTRVEPPQRKPPEPARAEPERKPDDVVKKVTRSARGMLGSLKGAAERLANRVAETEDSIAHAKRDAGRIVDNVLDGAEGIIKPFGIRNDPNARAPSNPRSLRIASFNVEKGGRQLDKVKAEITRTRPDVVGLQEVTRENAQKLAKDLRMNVAWYETYGVSGKAILSRYPIDSGEHVGLLKRRDYVGAYIDKVRETGKLDAGETLEARGMLRASIRAGGKTIDILDTHLSLGDPSMNARQLEAIHSFARDRRADGHDVVVLGDFNTNFSIKSHTRGTKGKGFPDPTDTPAEWKERYGPTVGNAGGPANLRALDGLRGSLNNYWDAPKTYVIDRSGTKMTSEDARAALTGQQAEVQKLTSCVQRRRKELQQGGKRSDGELASRSPDFKRMLDELAGAKKRRDELIDIADGNSHRSANKRFDNILSSLSIKEGWIDYSTDASDHQPVFAEISLR